jgi:hypothetical protein
VITLSSFPCFHLTLAGRKQAQWRDGGRQNVQPVVTHETSRSSGKLTRLLRLKINRFMTEIGSAL